MSKHQENVGWVLIAGFFALLLYMIKNAASILHESVTTSIAPDPATGAPQYDTGDSITVPETEAFAISPIGRTCPNGYTLWRNKADGSYHCLPNPQNTGFVQ